MDRGSFTLERLLQIHSAALLAEGKSPRTVEWHAASVRRFAKWVQGELDDVATLEALTLDNVRAWAGDLREQPRYLGHPTNCAPEQHLQDDSISYYIRGIRSFASWLEREEYTDENKLAKLKTPKVPDKEVDILSRDEIATIMQHFDHHNENGARDLAIFALLLDTGMRASELCGLKLGDLHLDEGYALVFGKGKKQRPVKVGSRASKTLRFYLAHWRKPARSNINNVFLTLSYKVGDDLGIWSGAGEPLTVNALQRTMRRIGKQTGVTRLHPHLLRHTFACLYLLEHHDPFALKNLLGHTSLTMTYRYVRAVERLMVVRGDALSVLDTVALPPPSSLRKKVH